MKIFKLITTAIGAALILTLNTTAFAQDTDTDPEQKQSKAMEQNKYQNGAAGQDAEKEPQKNQAKSQEKNTYQYGKQVKSQHGNRFQDANGDGVNDNAPDHDGDGIPNGKDADYDGAKNRSGNGKGGFVDVNGDGINDNAEDWDSDGVPNGQDPDFERPMDGSSAQHQYGKQARNQSGRGGFGPADGSGNAGVGPQDGSGNGPRTGDCDGTGPKGTSKGSKSGGKN